MKPVLAFSTALLAVALGGTGVGGAQQTTRATIYRAFRADGSSALRTRNRTGYCWTGSATAPRRDAWRCMTHNEIEDPCFSASITASSVLCPDAPWKQTGVRIRLPRPLPRRYAGAGEPSLRSQPWALELSDGRRCRLSSGASTVLEGHRLNYFCGGDSQTGLWGSPSRSSQPWTILIAPLNATRLLGSVAIRHAWM